LTFENNTESGLFCIEVKPDLFTPIKEENNEDLDQSEQMFQHNSYGSITNSIINFDNHKNVKNNTNQAMKVKKVLIKLRKQVINIEGRSKLFITIRDLSSQM
jgi:hypothetical protein